MNIPGTVLGLVLTACVGTSEMTTTKDMSVGTVTRGFSPEVERLASFCMFSRATVAAKEECINDAIKWTGTLSKHYQAEWMKALRR